MVENPGLDPVRQVIIQSCSQLELAGCILILPRSLAIGQGQVERQFFANPVNSHHPKIRAWNVEIAVLKCFSYKTVSPERFKRNVVKLFNHSSFHSEPFVWLPTKTGDFNIHGI